MVHRKRRIIIRREKRREQLMDWSRMLRISWSSKDGPSITNELSTLLEPNPEMSWSKVKGKRAIIKMWMIHLSFKINPNTEPEGQVKTSNKLEDKIAIT